jgi:hypothetical protein
MANLFIRNIDPALKRLIAELATKSGRSISNEAAALIRESILRDPRVGFGTWLFNLIDPQHRGDDLVFEVDAPVRPPPDFD